MGCVNTKPSISPEKSQSETSSVCSECKEYQGTILRMGNMTWGNHEKNARVKGDVVIDGDVWLNDPSCIKFGDKKKYCRSNYYKCDNDDNSSIILNAPVPVQMYYDPSRRRYYVVNPDGTRNEIKLG